jgi:hypothetical protein
MRLGARFNLAPLPVDAVLLASPSFGCSLGVGRHSCLTGKGEGDEAGAEKRVNNETRIKEKEKEAEEEDENITPPQNERQHTIGVSRLEQFAHFLIDQFG